MTRATAGRPDRQPHSPAQPLVMIVTFISKDRDERYVHHFRRPGPGLGPVGAGPGARPGKAGPGSAARKGRPRARSRGAGAQDTGYLRMMRSSPMCATISSRPPSAPT
jgi:hypothetical protein